MADAGERREKVVDRERESAGLTVSNR
jgi:hypothetical protein